MVFAIVLILLVVGSVMFHIISPWYLTELESNWSTIDFTIDLTFWVTGSVFVAVNLFMAYAVIRFRYKRNRRSEYKPEDKKLEAWLIGITTVGVAALLTPGLFVWAEFVTVPEDAHVIEAVGQQWHWSFRLPGKDGKFGAVESRYVTDDNPFGMDADDPAGQDDVLVSSQTVHLPIDKPVKVNLRSKDVLHNFAVAQFRVKMDMVPGLITYLWFTPTRTGEFEILCEELCGVAHHAMRGMVVVDEQADFDSWLAEQPTYAQVLAKKPGDAQLGQGNYAVCATCHGAAGEGNPNLNAPKLAGQEGWYLRRQIEYFKSGARGAHKDDEYGRQMAAMAAVLFNQAAVENVIAYIETLPDNPSPTTVAGDVEAGKKIYRTCGACHGVNGEGVAATNAPRQAGMSDWYLVNQLKNFRAGIRGAHSGDEYGMQMSLMAAILQTDERVNDVVAYINTLSGRKPQHKVATREKH
ncbi:MAG: c-type cytochrome [Gammaproteobacteria bacterium]